MKRTLGLGLSVLWLATGSALWAQSRIPAEYRINGFAIGCQAYSFNRFSVFEAIEKTAQAGAKVIEFYPGQKLSREEPSLTLDHNASGDVLAKVKAKLKEHGILAANYGVVGLPNNEAESRKVFEFARKMGIPAVTSEPSPDAMDLIERLVKEYDIQVGIHNHPRRPNDPNYKVWDPAYVLSMVKDRDRRIGAAADTGHWLRSDLQPIEALRLLEGRLISLHLKDLNQMGPSAHDVPYGMGVANVRGILMELHRQNFDGNISIEYEYNWDNSVPEIAQCIGFVRGFGGAAGPRRAIRDTLRIPGGQAPVEKPVSPTR
ncbi:MAG TPA: sugar phosphate isomerase/epimerase family protein [Candidatus Paceibacterota bacterium]|nr:sugar phosphate isomerase/epimerase family protein [Verrucomicrobiota bacterium]HRZ47204.1 sugar phosphate isomerase/epimerase family protein [Candidatus Paceibacterota bacterium]